MKLTILILFTFAVSALASPTRNTTTKVTDLKSLSTTEKLCLLILSSLDIEPKLQGDISFKSLFKADGDEYHNVDSFFVDVRAIMVQSIKLTEDAPLPAYDFYTYLDFCDGFGNCYNLSYTLNTGITQLKGQKRITSVNEVTPTHFKNTFTVPLFQMHADDFLFEIANHLSGHNFRYRNWRVTFNNMRLVTQFDYEFVPELGIQIRNLEINFFILSARSSISYNWHEYPDGTLIPLLPVYSDIGLYLNEEWTEYKEEYQNATEFRINCFLSGFRSNPKICTPTSDVGFMPEHYYLFNVIELFGTMGLASLDRK
ncbi:unnamed protein product [Orchesella dallaii]|uniref:Uncharacterized protein n=1 Tax=Orchesella dallaii TaxID=48710 RepID=A0ABP1S3Y2_9HEXA